MQIIHPKLPKLLTKVDDVINLFDIEDEVTCAEIEGCWLTTEQLDKTSISESLLSKVDFSQINVNLFNITDCELKGCNFTASSFPESSWHRVFIQGARCSGLQITNGTLKNVCYSNSKLEIVNFRFSRLENIIFEDCVLNDVDFYEARLKNVEFINCTINKITFANAKMMSVDISKSVVEAINGISSLRGVTMSYDQLMQLAPAFATEYGIKIK